MTNKSDGSSASYYELPKGCTQLQDLISHRNMNAQDGEIFRAIYRKGRASHSDELRDARKVLFYAQAEVERLETERELIDNALAPWPTEARIDTIGQNGNDGEHYQPLPALGTFLPEHGGVVVAPPDGIGLSLIVRSGPDVPVLGAMTGVEPSARLKELFAEGGWFAPTVPQFESIEKACPDLPRGDYWTNSFGIITLYDSTVGKLMCTPDSKGVLHAVKRVKL